MFKSSLLKANVNMFVLSVAERKSCYVNSTAFIKDES